MLQALDPAHHHQSQCPSQSLCLWHMLETDLLHTPDTVMVEAVLADTTQLHFQQMVNLEKPDRLVQNQGRHN